MSDKKILFLNNGLYPCVTGGIEIFHYYFIKAISQKRKAVVMTLCKSFLEHHNIEGYNISSPIGRLQTVFTIFHHLYRILCRRKDIGLIHIPYSSKDFFQYYHVMCLAYLHNIPYILRIHGGGMYPARPDNMHALYFKKASGIIAVSQPIKDEYEKRYGRPIKLIPSFLPFLQSSMGKTEIRKKHGVPSDSLVFLCLGSIKKIKGTDLLIDAVNLLGKDFLQSKKTIFIIVGGGELEKFLRSRVSELGLSGRVIFTGKVPYEQVHEHFQYSDVFLIPSLMEARPLVLAEALDNGLPAIGRNISTIANTIKHQEHGLLFPVGNSRELAESIRNIIENPEVRGKFRANSLKGKEQFNCFDKMVKDYIQYYDQLMI